MVEVMLKDVHKAWGSFVAVEGMNLTVNEGEFLVLLGPSGCGKTTTMRMIAGLEPLTRGEIIIGGEQVNDLLPRERDIAMVFQNYGLYPHMTVAENLAYPLRLRGVAKPERRRQVEAAARAVHLDGLLDRKPRALSGGQRQRVALARAIIRRPRLFLMDEPLSNLDAKLRVSMRAELKRLHHDLGTTTVYVTHDQVEAMTLATRVAVMSSGRIVQLGSSKEIYGDPATRFVAEFIGSPPMNFISGRASGGVLRVADHCLACLPASLSGELALGIRPEAVAIVAPDAGDLRGSVYAMEFTGSVTLVTVTVGDALITAVAEADTAYAFDELVGLVFDRTRLFLFDAVTGERLRA